MNIKNITAIFIGILFVVIINNACKHSVKNPEEIITVKGSNSEQNLMKILSETYKSKQPNTNFIISGGGSKKGIMALYNNDCDIANASRYINNDDFFVKSNLVNPHPIIIASDLVAIITHPENGVDSLSLEQLSQILRGVIYNWKQLDGNDLPIKIYGRDNNSGTKAYLLDILQCKKFSDLHTNFKTNKDIIDAVEKDRGAIGYVNIASLIDSYGKPYTKVWAVNLYKSNERSCSPYEIERARNNEYPLIRPLIQYVNKPSTNVLKFIKFELEEQQQNLLEFFGYLKINQVQKNLNAQQFVIISDEQK